MLISTRLLVAAAGLYYAFLLSDGTFNLFGHETLSFVYNDMALRLLHWDFTIDPDIIGVEGFLRDGRTVTYFGVLPALLRLPLVMFVDLRVVQVGRLSCWLALLLSAWVQASLLMLLCRSPAQTATAKALYFCTLIALLFTGPQLAATVAAGVYNEPIVWSNVFSLCFLRIGLGRALDGGPLRRREWAGLGLCAGLGLAARAPEGCGMIVSLVALAAVGYLADARALVQRAPRARLGDFFRVLAQSNAWFGALSILPFAALVLVVNGERWGNPFVFVNWDLHKIYLTFPAALYVHKTFGDMSPVNIPFDLLMFLLGPLKLLQRVGHGSLYPPRSFLAASATALLLLGAIGCGGLIRRGGARRFHPVFLASLLLAPVVQLAVMLCFRDVNFRYNYEFVPLLAVDAAFGVRELAGMLRPPWTAPVTAVLILITAANIAETHIEVLQAKLYFYTRTQDERSRIMRLTEPFSGWFVLPDELDPVPHT